MPRPKHRGSLLDTPETALKSLIVMSSNSHIVVPTLENLSHFTSLIARSGEPNFQFSRILDPTRTIRFNHKLSQLLPPSSLHSELSQSSGSVFDPAVIYLFHILFLFSLSVSLFTIADFIHSPSHSTSNLHSHSTPHAQFFAPLATRSNKPHLIFHIPQ